MTPRVSVVMRVYNAARHLREALESVLAQTYSDFEIVVVDDGSTDESPAILASYADSRLRVVHQSNAGHCAAAIRCVAESRGEYIAMLDADDRSAPGRLAAQVSFLDEHQDVVLLGSAVSVIDETGRVVGRRRYPTDDAAIRRAAVVFNPFAHSSNMYRRRAAVLAGNYPTAGMCEDYDFNLRLMKIGQVANLPDALTDYRLPGQNVSRRAKGVLRATIGWRDRAHRVYGFPRSVRSTAVDAAQRALTLAPGSLVNWICERAFYRHA